MPRYLAVLDACVLVPIALADTLLRVAEQGLYRPLWSDRILAEAQMAIEEIHPGIEVGKRFASMRETFGDALVTGWEQLEPGIRLPDENDRHVVAAAGLGWRPSTLTTSCSISLISVRPPFCGSSVSKLAGPGIRHELRRTWPLSSAGQAYQALPSNSFA
jgi:hypothetical protein